MKEEPELVPTSPDGHAGRLRSEAALILPRCNIAAMNLHLQEIAAAVAPGAHAMLLLDQAGCRRHVAHSVSSSVKCNTVGG